VRITDKGIAIRGQGMEYDLEQESYDVGGRVRVDIQ
jgi:hypothetical protein